MPKVVTANALATGKVVFLGCRGTWVEALDEARQFADAAAVEEGLAQAEADVARALVVEPFAADTGAAESGRAKMTLRDTIRANGPTINYLPNGARSA